MFIPDYHETEEAFPLVYDLGRFSLEWNMVEHFFSALIWEFIGDFAQGMAITSGMGNQSRADVLLSLARQRDDPELVEHIEFACKAFNILRENRNLLMHSHSIFPPEKKGQKPHWRRATGRGPEAHASVEADLADLEELIALTAALGMFAVGLSTVIRPRRPGPRTLPDKFPLPRKLKTPPPEAPEGAPPPRRSSRAKSRAR